MKIKNSSTDDLFNGKNRNIMSYNVSVIGGGPAGIMAAISAAKMLSKKSSHNKKINTKSKIKTKKNNEFQDVVLIEKNETLGKKLLLTGGGRCNITNNSDLKTHINAFGKNSSFLKPSLYNFDNKSLLTFFKDKGLDFKVESHGKVYPADDKSSSVLKLLEEYLQEYNVRLLLGHKVSNIEKNEDYFDISMEKHLKPQKTSNEFQNNVNQKNFNIKNLSIKSSKVILATGGLSYPSTGSTGDGMKFAQNLGHKLTKLNPGLTPLKVQEEWIKDLSGIKFENVGLSFRNSSKKRVSYMGTILFTHFGLSGPGILDLSREISLLTNSHINSQNFSKNNERNNKEKIGLNNFPMELFLDLIPEISIDELKDKFNLEFSKNGKTIIKNYLKSILPNKFIIPFLTNSNIDPNIQLSKISKKEKNRLITNLKDLKIHINGLMPFKSAMVTCGGVYHKNIDSKTMESKIVEGMYFSGEIIEFCGLSGGYNLQMAFSTGYTAGKSSANSLIYFPFL
ncbi:MAG: NAD(P)/FAD-dependent oxidoreductase [Methanobacteriaceae archaeon]|nr:NAD(P)/FAD-dependent oxidoreductase [Methanobacteriaceae archaeon]